MIEQTRRALKLPPEQILHVGDHPETDVLGARLHGFRAAWLNERQQPWHSVQLLPDVEINGLEELAGLLL
jgi:FMN phosphatase YigB (HAD superfamily)